MLEFVRHSSPYSTCFHRQIGGAAQTTSPRRNVVSPCCRQQATASHSALVSERPAASPALSTDILFATTAGGEGIAKFIEETGGREDANPPEDHSAAQPTPSPHFTRPTTCPSPPYYITSNVTCQHRLGMFSRI
jgi:hypothetical protein